MLLDLGGLTTMQIFAQEMIYLLVPGHTKWSKMMLRVVHIEGCARPWIKSKILLRQAWGMMGCALPVDISHIRVILDGPRAMSCSLRPVIAVLYALIPMS